MSALSHLKHTSPNAFIRQFMCEILSFHYLAVIDISNVTANIFWLPGGLELVKNYIDCIRSTFLKASFQETSTPALIPLSDFVREQRHFNDLSKISYSFQADDDQFYLRPTSEITYSRLFHIQLSRGIIPPLRYFQITRVHRHEDADKLIPLIRDRDIWPFAESYSIYEPSCESQHTQQEIQLYSSLLQMFGIAHLINIRPRHDTFPEAKYSVTFDCLLPNGYFTQLASVHAFGSSFSNPFELVSESNGEYYFQSSTGISSRALGYLLLTGESNEQLVLPDSLTSAKSLACFDSNHIHTTSSTSLYADGVKRLAETRGSVGRLHESAEHTSACWFELLLCNDSKCKRALKYLLPLYRELGMAWHDSTPTIVGEKCFICKRSADHEIRYAKCI